MNSVGETKNCFGRYPVAGLQRRFTAAILLDGNFRSGLGQVKVLGCCFKVELSETALVPRLILLKKKRRTGNEITNVTNYEGFFLFISDILRNRTFSKLRMSYFVNKDLNFCDID